MTSLKTGDGSQRLARMLGWASLGLGVAQLAAPGAVRRLSGLDDSPTARLVVPAVGARELVHAAGLLRGARPTGWVWTRVAGDALDLTALAMALARRSGTRRRRVVAVTAAVAAITAVDVFTAVRAGRGARTADRVRHVAASVTVNRKPDEVYAFWRNFENLPSFMGHLESVESIGWGRSHWRAKAPAGTTVQWEAEVIEDRPGELISWRSRAGADVTNSGSVQFAAAPGARGTEVRVELDYEPPAGRLGTRIAKLFGEEPEQQVRDDLRRLKQVMETGELARCTVHPR